MFIQSKAATSNKHKNGLAIEQRLGGRETLIQWSNGDHNGVKLKTQNTLVIALRLSVEVIANEESKKKATVKTSWTKTKKRQSIRKSVLWLPYPIEK